MKSEPDAHAISVNLLTVVRAAFICLVVLTLLLLFISPTAAQITAIPIPVVCLIWLISRFMEKQSRAAALRVPGETSMSDREIHMDAETAATATLIKIIGLLALGTFMIAAIFFDLAFIAVGASVLFLLALLINIPYLGLIAWETSRDETERVSKKSRER